MVTTTRVATPGMHGFDVNRRVSASGASALRAAGYAFAVRYLPRVTQGRNDLTIEETSDLLSAGLALMPVQHVESEAAWNPTAAKGTLYGQTAVTSARACGFLAGCTIWLDLEGVAASVPQADVQAYCRAWCAEVIAAGFEPGVYVGWHCGLTPKQLYALPFKKYWAAYNLNADEYPAVRGICMKQRLLSGSDIDGDVIQADKLGGLPTLLVRGEP